MRRAAFVPGSPQGRTPALRPHTHLAEPRGICRPAENISKPSVVRRIPTVKGRTSVWRDCCPYRPRAGDARKPGGASDGRGGVGEREANAARRKSGGTAERTRGRGGGSVELRRTPARRSQGAAPGGSGRGHGRGSGSGRGQAVPALRLPADQPGPARRGASGARPVRPPAPSPGPSSGVSARAPGVWPCARPCALARSPRERLHGCCVGRPAVLDTAGWGNTVASFPAGGGPVRGADCASRTWRGAGGGTRRPYGSQGDRLALAGLGRSVPQALCRHGAYRYECVYSWPCCVGRSVPAPPEIGRMSPVGRGWADGFADIPTVLPVRYRPWPDPGRHAGMRAGTQRAESAPPLTSAPTRAGRSRNTRSGSRSPAFARGACAPDVRRP